MNKPHIINFQNIGSPEKGMITVAQYGQNVPFAVKRIYWVYDNPEGMTRGNHAHAYSEQLIIAVHGKINVVLEDTKGNKQTFMLDKPGEGLYVPKMYWRVIDFDSETVCLCLSSHEYDDADYIRDYNQFKKNQ